MKPRIFFVTGVPGIGKTSVIKPLQAILGPSYRVRDFDERGVPDNVSIRWRMREMEHWRDEATKLAYDGITTVVCGNVMPSEASTEIESHFVFLDAKDDKLRGRLLERYKDAKKVEDLKRMTGLSPEESVKVNMRNAGFLRMECDRHKIEKIDTSDIGPEQVAESVAAFIRRKPVKK